MLTDVATLQAVPLRLQFLSIREAIVSDSSCDPYFCWLKQLLGEETHSLSAQGACCGSGCGFAAAQEGLRCAFLLKGTRAASAGCGRTVGSHGSVSLRWPGMLNARRPPGSATALRCLRRY